MMKSTAASAREFPVARITAPLAVTTRLIP
jgi:hypothetical protein